jgi:hypothetical protein
MRSPYQPAKIRKKKRLPSHEVNPYETNKQNFEVLKSHNSHIR